MSATIAMVFVGSVFTSAAPQSDAGGHPTDTLTPATNVRRAAPGSADLRRTEAAPSDPLSRPQEEPAADPALSRSRQRNARRAARAETRRREAFNALPQAVRDSIAGAQFDSLVARKADSLAARQTDTLAAVPARADSLSGNTAGEPRAAEPFLDDPITGQNADSLVYDVRSKMVYISTRAT